jgi:hypothetical protein
MNYCCCLSTGLLRLSHESLNSFRELMLWNLSYSFRINSAALAEGVPPRQRPAGDRKVSHCKFGTGGPCLGPSCFGTIFSGTPSYIVPHVRRTRLGQAVECMIEGMHRKNFLCGFIGEIEMQKEGRDVSTIWKIPRMSKSVIALRDGGRTASVCLSLRLCHGHGFAVHADP